MKIGKLELLQLKNEIVRMDECFTPEGVFSILSCWLKENYNALEEKPFSLYNLRMYANLELESYPVELSGFDYYDFKAFKNHIQKYSLQDMESFARLIRNVLESLIVLRIDEDCLRCGYMSLGIYKDISSGSLIYECKNCGMAIFADTQGVVGSVIAFATKSDLLRWKIIGKKEEKE